MGYGDDDNDLLGDMSFSHMDNNSPRPGKSTALANAYKKTSTTVAGKESSS